MAAKNAVLVLRIIKQDKSLLVNAAKQRGQSLTSFLVKTGLREAKKALKGVDATRPEGIRGAGRSFFHALCSEAALGGANSYFELGYRLARHTPGMPCHDLELPTNAGKLPIEFKSTHRKRDMWASFASQLAEYHDLESRVPPRRKEAFLRGIRAACLKGAKAP